jgi:N-methylhydantoinase B
LAEAAPDRVTASGCVPPWLLQFNGVGLDSQPYALPLAIAGGQGAGAQTDGLSSATFPTNSSNIPIEVIEASTPLRFLEKALVAGSAGKGLHSGGLGQRVAIRNDAGTAATVSILADQLTAGPEGLFGGESGARGEVILGTDPQRRGKQRISLAPGETLTVVLPGGGGFGPHT